MKISNSDNVECDVLVPKLCRTCKHDMKAHYRQYGMPSYILPTPCRLQNDVIWCRCDEYLPTDNLEYLEYMELRNGKQIQA